MDLNIEEKWKTVLAAEFEKQYFKYTMGLYINMQGKKRGGEKLKSNGF